MILYRKTAVRKCPVLLGRMNLKSYCSLVIFREARCWHGMNRNPEYYESCNYKM